MALKLMRQKVAPASLTRVRYAEANTDGFYQSPEHRAWRAAVLKKDRFVCQGEGPHNGPLHADHIVERSDGGAEFDPANGRALCQACHNRKTAAARAERLCSRRPARG